MNATTLKALEASIRHWERMRDGKRHIMGTGDYKWPEMPVAEHCALCRLFLIGVEMSDSCVGCPVNDAGHRHCRNTPYEQAHLEHQRNGQSASFRAAAAREVEFLRGLLP